MTEVCKKCGKSVPQHIRHESFMNGHCRWLVRTKHPGREEPQRARGEK